MKVVRRIWIISLLLVYFSPIQGLPFLRARQISTKEGLSNNTVRCILQDNDGFLWFGTYNGLNRYDGNRVRIFADLPDSRIESLAKDTRGFLWITSYNAQISCFDTKKECFVDLNGQGDISAPYSHVFFDTKGDAWLWDHWDQGLLHAHWVDGHFISRHYGVETGELQSNAVVFVEEDPQGTLWIGTQKGLTSILDGKAHLVESENYWIKAFFFEGRAYFLSRTGLLLANGSEGSAQYKWQTVATIPTDYVSSAVMRGHILLLFTGDQTYEFDLHTQQLVKSLQLDVPYALTRTDNRGDYILYNETGLVWYVPKDANRAIKNFSLTPLRRLGLIDRERYSAYVDTDNRLWITTYGNGVFVYNIKTDELTHLNERYKEYFADSDFVFTLFEDASNALWLGTEHSGVHRLSFPVEGFTKPSLGISPNSIFSEQIRTITETDEGHFFFSNSNGELHQFDASFRYLGYERFSFNINAILFDRTRQMFLGSLGNGLRIGTNWYQDQRNAAALSKFQYIYYLPHTQPKSVWSSNYVQCLYEDRKGRVWGGTLGKGLFLIESSPSGYAFASFLTDGDLMSRQVQAIVEDQAGRMWVGSKNGLYVFHPDSLLNDSNAYRYYNKQNSGLQGNDVTALAVGTDGALWIGTSGQGVHRHLPTKILNPLRMDHFDESVGLSSNEVQGLIVDDIGDLWISSKNGLTRYAVDSAETGHFSRYFFSSSPNGDTYTTAVCKSRDGRLLFGTNQGILVANPKHIATDPPRHQPILTNLYINGSLVKPGDSDSTLNQILTHTQNLSLLYNQHSFAVEFSDLNYEEEPSYYSYRLIGYDDRWSEPSVIPQASFKYVPSGRYELQVRSLNSHGLWSPQYAKLQIRIYPPVWRSPWAYVFYSLLTLLIIYVSWILFGRFFRMKQRINTEMALMDYRLKFFTNIAHEFRNPLTLIQGSLDTLEQHPSIPENSHSPLKIIRSNSQRLLKLIDQLLLFRKMQKKSLTPVLETVELVGFVKEIFELYTESAGSRQITYRYIPFAPHYENCIDKGFVEIILHNLLSNAIKFTPDAGHIELHLFLDEVTHSIGIQVNDSGIGIPQSLQDRLFTRFAEINPSNNSFGIGLNLAAELAIAHHGELKFQPNEPNGSRFTLHLPITTPIDAPARMPAVESVPYKIPVDSEPVYLDGLERLMRILIIEDHRDLREYIQDIMRRYFETQSVANGREGLLEVERFCPDLILCDVMMPILSGFEFLERIKAEVSLSHIPVILLTSLTDERDRLRAFELGADDFITKPFGADLLLSRVFQCLRLNQYTYRVNRVLPVPSLSNDFEKRFLNRLQTVVEHNYINPAFDMNKFAAIMGYGRTVFFRKVKDATGKTPNRMIRDARLAKAKELLLDDRLTVSEVAFRVGFTDPSYFGKCFKLVYGVSPTSFMSR